jgi:hypothetical protein
MACARPPEWFLLGLVAVHVAAALRIMSRGDVDRGAIVTSCSPKPWYPPQVHAFGTRTQFCDELNPTCPNSVL